MAIRNVYANTDLQNDKLADSVAITGNKVLVAIATMETLADDAAGTVYRLFPGLNPNLIPADIKIYNDKLNSGTGDDFDLGLYEGNGGAVIDKDCFVDGMTFASARPSGSGLNGLSAVDISKFGNKLFEHAGHTIINKKPCYDISLTCNTAANTAGTITVVATFVQG